MILLLIAFASTFICGKVFLKYLIKQNYIQPIYDDAPQAHQSKAGTPTMGAISFIIPIILYLIVMLSINFWYAFSLLIVVLGYGYIGLKDDYLKVFHRKNDSGLTPSQKLSLQFLISAIIIGFLIYFNHSTVIQIFDYELDLGFVYYLMVPILIVGMSNATNLTDGLDGLLTSITILVFIVLITLSNIDFITNFLTYIVGCFLAFLICFNKNPAKMFMGDTGSLVIGALFAVIIVILKIEFLGLILGMIYIIEVLSVVIQVSYFKYTKAKYGVGKRIFKMAPLHHHYEKSGYSEKKIVVMFSVIQLLITVVVFLIR